MRALEALRAQIEFNRGAVPVLPPGALTLADVDKVIADERIEAAAETVQDLRARAEGMGCRKSSVPAASATSLGRCERAEHSNRLWSGLKLPGA